ncbi:MAG TPA: hypothetical protein VMU65_07455 [Candidatus Saccharimonadales bacterium]|nr:hypothetical protein [Candidatus Saccharimonadales bacterium]
MASRGHGHFRRLAGLGEEGCFVESDDPRLLLGVFAPDRVRSIVVITTDGELAVAIRETVPAGIAVVRDARPDDAAEVAGACLPWPWMVVGSTASLTPELASMLQTRPVLTLWLGAAPAGLPSHTARFDRHTPLLAAVEDACGAKVGDMRLAPGSGVDLGDGTLLRGATLDALIGAYPRGFALPSRTFRSAGAALARADAGWTTERDASACIALVPCTHAAAAQ